MSTDRVFYQDLSLEVMLNRQFEFQRHLVAKGKLKELELMTVKERIQYVRDNLFALDHEGHELINNTSWKPWADGERFDREKCIEELADMFAFLFNITLAVGFANPLADWETIAEEVGEAIWKKVELNHERQRRPEGYEGVGGK